VSTRPIATALVLCLTGLLASDSRAEMRPTTPGDRARYAYLPANAPIRALGDMARTPPGFERVAVEAGSFAAFLRGLPLRAAGASVRSFDREIIVDGDDPRLYAVAELDVGHRDLQQCADSAIRLHAEWLWSRGLASQAAYRFVSGDVATFSAYAAGERPLVAANRVRWERRAEPRSDRVAYRAFLEVVFTYASTLSLARELVHVARAEVSPGDVFVAPGSPGHAVLVLDVARDRHGRRVALLGQGYMPAQDFHVLASAEEGLSPWFSLETESVKTPFWPKPFSWAQLGRFARPTEH